MESPTVTHAEKSKKAPKFKKTKITGTFKRKVNVKQAMGRFGFPNI
jgi:hypothetical protein